MSLILLFVACANPEPVGCPLWFTDLDGDGYGAGDGVTSCTPLVGRSEVEGDCDDRDSSVHPGAIDSPYDGIDQDCDGEDTCAQATRVQTVEEVDCAQGQFIVDGTARTWPEGDCICAVQVLALPADQAKHLAGGLAVVSDTLTLGYDTPWNGRGLEGLNRVGTATLTLDGAAELSALQHIGLLEVNASGDSTLSFPALTELKGLLLLSGPMDVRAEALQLAEELSMELDPGFGFALPSLTRVESMTVIGPGLVAPKLRSAGVVSLYEVDLELPALEVADRIGLTGILNAPRLRQLSSLYGYEYGLLNAPKLSHVDALSHLEHSAQHQGMTAPFIESAPYIQVLRSGVLELPLLQSTEHIELSNGQLRVPLLQRIETLETSDAVLEAPLLVEIGEMALRGTEVLFSHPESIEVVGSISTSIPLSLPELRQLEQLHVTFGGEAQLPKLRTLDLLWTQGPVELLSLTHAEALNLKNTGNTLPALRSVGTLETWDCQAFPALQYLSGAVTPHCALDLSRVQSLPDPLIFAASAEGSLILPEPFDGALWIRPMGEVGVLSAERVLGAVSVSHNYALALSDDIEIEQVGGQLHLSLYRATELGGLENLGAVDGDLTYCMPLIPDVEVQAWLSTLTIGGEVINRCP
jgi:hypothetical protein